MDALNRVNLDDIRIERFFDCVHEQLRPIPWSECSRIHQELYLHLEQIVDARIASGSSPGEAVESALRQIGKPRELGRKMRQEWYLSDRRPAGVTLLTLGAAYLWFYLFLLIFGAIAAEFFSPNHNNINNHNAALLLCAPVLAGIALAIWRSREAVAGVTQMVAGLYLFYVMIWAAGTVCESVFPEAHAPVTGPWYLVIFAMVPVFAGLAFISALPAYLISALKAGSFYRITLSDFRLAGRTASH